MATAPFGRGRSVASCQYLGHVTRWAYWDSRRYRKKSRTIWRQHDGDCAFWSGQVSGFVPILRTRHTMGVLGQSPLPEKEPHDLEAVQWRLRLLGRGRSVASCQYLGHVTRWACGDSRRYRKKSRTIWKQRDGD